MSYRIGVFTPRADMFPTLGKDLLQGLRLGLGEEEEHIQFTIENIGNATQDSLIKTAEKYLIQESLDLIISFCGSNLLEYFVKSFKSYQIPLIHLDLGANALKKVHESDYIAYHHLHLWQTAYTAGKYAAKHLGSKSLVVSSFYDGGYQHSESLVAGFRDHGGENMGFEVFPMDYKTVDFKSLIERIEAKAPEVVFLNFSYKEADWILEKLSNSSLNGKLPFMALPMLTDESMYEKDHGMQQLFSVASWSFDQENPAMIEFLKDMEATHQQKPNIIHLLGYETGLILAQLLKKHHGIPKQFKDSLQNMTIEAPRGTLSYNAKGELIVDEFKLREFSFNEVRYHNHVVATLESNFSEAMYKHMEEIPYSGWQNPYICT